MRIILIVVLLGSIASMCDPNSMNNMMAKGINIPTAAEVTGGGVGTKVMKPGKDKKPGLILPSIPLIQQNNSNVETIGGLG